MYPKAYRICGLWTIALLGLSAGAPASAARFTAQGAAESTTPNAIACKILEAKTAGAVRVTAAVFHQAESAQREELGTWLRAHDGAEVEFEAAGGQWHAATVFRLRTCFGRGLLIFSAAEAKLEQGVTIQLRFREKGAH